MLPAPNKFTFSEQALLSRYTSQFTQKEIDIFKQYRTTGKDKHLHLVAEFHYCFIHIWTFTGHFTYAD
jgi:hypothetical protein